MLYLIKGRAGSGKTQFLRETIVNELNKNIKPLLIVPEQFSFESERNMLKFLGAKNYHKTEIKSFKRLALSALKNTSYLNKKTADEGVRAALMSEALLSLEGRLNVFSSVSSTYTSLVPLVDFCKELKYCNITADDLCEKSLLLSEGLLKEKLADISLISETYDALLTQSYFDDTDIVNMLCEYARNTGFFCGKTVIIDGFRSFIKQESECFGIILSQAENVYVSLCMDENSGKSTPFYYIKEFENKLRTIANNYSVIVSETFLEQDTAAFSEDIFQLEKNIFSEDKTQCVNSNGSLSVVKCTDKENECRYVASEIKKLLRSGEYRCRDIAIIERVGGSYKDLIIDELKNLDIPVFEDGRRSLKYEALFVYISAVLSCLTSSFNTENILTFLKSGLSSLSLTEISRLEKYALIWGVGAGEWRNGFTMHPDGFGNELDDNAKIRLKELNESRKSAVGPILKLKKDCENKTGAEISEIIYNFLCSSHIQEKLFDLYTQLKNDGFPVEANRQEVSWNALMEILDEMAVLGDERCMTLSRWSQLFSVLVDSGEIGEIPQGLDEIKVGNADRIRTEKLKVVFLVGVNKDEFPLVSIQGGVLTDKDRVSLTKLGLEIKPSYRDSVYEEHFIAYCAVTAASEKLYLTYKTIDSDGTQLQPSEIIETAINCIENISIVSTTDLDPLYMVESDDDAFSLLAKSFNEDSVLKETLVEYFEHKENFSGRLRALNNVAGKRDFSFTDKSVSQKLFKSDMYLSASRVEAYYNCPFSYFVRYGLKAEPLKTAELDPAQSGTIVHLVMERILKKYPKGDFLSVTDDELKAYVSLVLDEYINEKMGGTEGKTKRFIFLYNRLIDTCMAIISRLKQEFSVGAFAPCGFEVSIGSEEVPAYEVELETGKVFVKGSIDRVDMMERDGVTYLRVIDYKTGKKEFKLSELFDGLNIQMVLYLMALEKNGKSVYGDFIPSGVLYLPSKIGISDYLKSRSPKVEEISYQKTLSGKLSGMILESLVVMKGMGAIDSPKYFPASYDDVKEKYTGNTFTQSDFKKLSKMVDKKIKGMGDALHNGEIPAIPAGESDEGKMCKYCSYKSICGYEYGDEIRKISDFDHKKALELLGGDEDEQNNLDTKSGECN